MINGAFFFPPSVKHFLCARDIYSFKGKGILFTCKFSLSSCMNIVKSDCNFSFQKCDFEM